MKLLCQVFFCLKCFDLQHHIILFCPGEFRSGAVLAILAEMVNIQHSCVLIPQEKVGVSQTFSYMAAVLPIFFSGTLQNRNQTIKIKIW